MIPADYVTQWRWNAPWIQDSQVEQDLLLSRALVEMFQRETVRDTLALRGGTALNKLYLVPAARYSEDIDLVQVVAGPIGPALDATRAALDPWLGKPRRSFKEGRVTLVYRAASEDTPPIRLRLKVEINSREHFSVFELEQRLYEVDSRWFFGSAPIRTYHLDELLGTKLRALYQRKKGRDLFDLWRADQGADVDASRVVECFIRYLDHDGRRVSRAEFEANLEAKLDDPEFSADLSPLLAAGQAWDIGQASAYVRTELIARLPGEPWKGSTSRS